jgi:hypothetical protein
MALAAASLLVPRPRWADRVTEWAFWWRKSVRERVRGRRGTAITNTRTGLVATLAALGAGVGLAYTARTYRLSREGHLTDRYTKAVEQLGSDKIEVQLGGIYALERLMRDSSTDQPTIVEVLAAYEAEAGFVTPIGQFSVEERIYSTAKDEGNSLVVVMRHKVDGIDFDNAYRVKSDEELVAIIDGHIEFRFTNHRVFVDASAGNVGTIELRRATPPTTVPPPISSSPSHTAPVELTDGLTVATHPRDAEFREGFNSTCYFDVNGFNMQGDAGRCYSVGDFFDADISVTVRWVSGSPSARYGLSLRSDNSFWVTGDGSWSVSRDFGATTLRQPTKSPAIGMGVNRLRVRMSGSRFEFYIDSTKLGEISDSSTGHGALQLLAYNGGYGGNSHVIFSDLIIRSLG